MRTSPIALRRIDGEGTQMDGNRAADGQWHLMGAGGSGMVGLALLLESAGESVTGCDAHESEALEELARHGIEMACGHRPEHLSDCRRLVVSRAIHPRNPEVVEALRRGLTVEYRGERLAALFNRRRGIAVAGSHGKSTTAGWIGWCLREAGLEPTVYLGARLSGLGTPVLVGGGDLFVAESDESDASFELLHPWLAVVTNVDDDHLERYGSMERMVEGFRRFVDGVRPGGYALLAAEDPLLGGIRSRTRIVTYGLGTGELRAGEVRSSLEGENFRVRWRGRDLGLWQIRLHGLHNVRNALAVIGTLALLGLDVEESRRLLQAYRGVARRLEHVGEAAGRHLLDDFGHHPAEVEATLRAARKLAGGGRLLVIFQPHRYTRTRRLAEAFGPALALADQVWVMPVYAAGEEPLPGADPARIVEAVRRAGGRAELAASGEEAAAAAAGRSSAGDLILTLGAGDVYTVGPEVLRQLNGERAVGTGGGTLRRSDP
ncbi:MAG: UDP-N-acetylmuramate--L-alanine ligase [Bacillota bacterium]|nr:UDP-N-acetylmuramate--L-alanine ligase [Bacillota bacterium]